MINTTMTTVKSESIAASIVTTMTMTMTMTTISTHGG